MNNVTILTRQVVLNVN